MQRFRICCTYLCQTTVTCRPPPAYAVHSYKLADLCNYIYQKVTVISQQGCNVSKCQTFGREMLHSGADWKTSRGVGGDSALMMIMIIMMMMMIIICTHHTHFVIQTYAYEVFVVAKMVCV